MARTLTSAASTEAVKTTGAHFVRILEIQWPGGTVYYSTEVLASPVTTQARVIKWGDRELSAQVGKANSHGTYTVELADTDFALKTLFDASPGVQNVPAYVHLFFVGTTWPTDRVTEFGGILTTPLEWTERGTWQVTIRGFEHHFNRDVGFLLTRQDFPEVNCAALEGKTIPVVYGNPCYRVPAAVIDRPGRSVLASTLNFCNGASLTIPTTAGNAGFTAGSSIDLIVGAAGRWERVTGSFANSSATSFAITSRGSVQASGTIPGFLGSGGIQYILLPKSAFADFDPGDPDTPASRGGYPLCIQDQGGSWHVLMITYWIFSGSSVAVAPKGQLDIVTGANFKVSTTPGEFPVWHAGTPVYEVGNWTYVCNFLPSKSVDRVEARASVNFPGGDSRELWGSINSAYWTASTNNKDHNAALGRAVGAAGITTITIAFTPQQLGVEEETFWVTLKGIEDVGDGSGTVITNPARVIEHLLTHEFLGDLTAATFVDSDSVDDAAAATSSQLAFALLERKKLHDLCSEIAHQGQLLYFWDQGKAFVNAVSNTLSALDSQLTVTNSNRGRGSLRISEVNVKDFTTQMLGKFRMAVPAPESVLARKSQTAIDEFGFSRDELNLWAHQYPTSVALLTEFHLKYRLNLQRLVTFDTFLMGLHLQPGDTITLDIDDGSGNAVLDSVLARVRSVQQKAADAARGAMEMLTVTCELKLWDFAIETDTPSDEGCVTGQRRGMGRSEGRKVFVRSEGINSMYVLAPHPAEIEGGGSNLFAPFDPGYDPNDGIVGIGIGFAHTDFEVPPTAGSGSGTGGGGGGGGGSGSGCGDFGTQIFLDNFSDSNGTELASHTPDVDNGDATYSTVVGANGDWLINGAAAKVEGTVPAGGLTASVIDVFQKNPQIVLGTFGGGGTLKFGIIFRYTDTSNYWYAAISFSSSTFAATQLYKVEGGAETLIGEDTDFILSKIECCDESIDVYGGVGGIIISTTSSFNKTATQIGVIAKGTSGDLGSLTSLEVKE